MNSRSFIMIVALSKRIDRGYRFYYKMKKVKEIINAFRL